MQKIKKVTVFLVLLLLTLRVLPEYYQQLAGSTNANTSQNQTKLSFGGTKTVQQNRIRLNQLKAVEPINIPPDAADPFRQTTNTAHVSTASPPVEFNTSGEFPNHMIPPGQGVPGPVIDAPYTRPEIIVKAIGQSGKNAVAVLEIKGQVVTCVAGETVLGYTVTAIAGDAVTVKDTGDNAEKTYRLGEDTFS